MGFSACSQLQVHRSLDDGSVGSSLQLNSQLFVFGCTSKWAFKAMQSLLRYLHIELNCRIWLFYGYTPPVVLLKKPRKQRTITSAGVL